MSLRREKKKNDKNSLIFAQRDKEKIDIKISKNRY